MSEPLYGCENEHCSEECCYPVNMLRVHKGMVWCEGCWDEAPPIWLDGNGGDDGGDYLRWNDLEPFVPDHEKRIAELEAELALEISTRDCAQKDVMWYEAELEKLREALHEIYGKACQAMSEDDDLYLYSFAKDARDIALEAAKLEKQK